MTRNSEITRRSWIKATGALGTAGLTGLSGCLGGGDDDGDGDGDGADGDGQPGENAFEIIHWWTAGGEREALDALLDGFLAEYGYAKEIIDDNPAPGGAGSAVDAVIQSRIIDEDPPSTFQIWPGESLRPYTDAAVLADIGDLWTDDMRDAYLDGVMDLASPEGNLVSVPINIHRMNNLFYNVEVIDEVGIDPEAIADPVELLDAFEAADTAGSTGLAKTSQAWSMLQMWESLYIGLHGVDGYESFLDRDLGGLEDDIRETLELVVDYREFFSEDASSIAWDEANAQVIDGSAAFIHQGDWAAGQYGAADLEYQDEWDFIPVPGTEGVYQVVMDSFVLPEPNPSPQLTEEFLSYCGTIDAQERFNPIKGSIPPRTDVPTDDFGPFLQDQMDDFAASTAQPPTVAHGSGFDPEGKSTLEEIFSQFIENWDAEQTTNRIIDEL